MTVRFERERVGRDEPVSIAERRELVGTVAIGELVSRRRLVVVAEMPVVAVWRQHRVDVDIDDRTSTVVLFVDSTPACCCTAANIRPDTAKQPSVRQHGQSMGL